MNKKKISLKSLLPKKWIFNGINYNEFENILVGFITSSTLFINSRKILVPLFAVFTWMVIFLPFFFLQSTGETVTSMPSVYFIYIFLILLIYSFISYFLSFSKSNNFQVKTGIKKFFRGPVVRTALYTSVPFFFVISIIFLIRVGTLLFNYYNYSQPLSYDMFSNLLILIFLPLTIFVSTLIFFLFMYALPGLEPRAYIRYAINVFKGEDSFLLKKRKLYCLLKMAYLTYEREMAKYFGKDTKEMYNCDNILKLSSFVSTMDVEDKKSQKDLLQILIDLNNVCWYAESNKYKSILKKIDMFVTDFTADIRMLKKSLLRQKLRRYSYLVISLIIMAINAVFFLFKF